jgi:tRNA(fMet)-specific endonuclease VapC
VTTYCLDTNTIVRAVAFDVATVDHLTRELRFGNAVVVPVVVLFELDYGIAKSRFQARNREQLRAFLEPLEVIEFDEADAREAADVRADLERRGVPIGPYDVLIAAQARRRGAVLVTGNRREFDRVPGLTVTNWSE